MVFRKLLEHRLRSLRLKRERVVREHDRRLREIGKQLERLAKEQVSTTSERAKAIRERMGQLQVQEVLTKSYRVSIPRELDIDIRRLEARLARPSLEERFKGWLKNRRKK